MISQSGPRQDLATSGLCTFSGTGGAAEETMLERMLTLQLTEQMLMRILLSGHQAAKDHL